MNFFEFASHMYPFWLFGIAMFCAVWNSKFKNLLSFDKKAFAKFFLYMIFISTVRILLFKLLPQKSDHSNLIASLLLGATLFVFWEDLIHGVPLAILKRVLGDGKWSKLIYFSAMLLVMFAFGSGHTYQGVYTAAMISLYIPWSVSFGNKRGFGTLMAGHMLYDFLTLGIAKLLVG